MEAPNNELMSALASLFEAGKYSDLTIVCGSRKYAAHKAIICSRSEFFDGACSNAFREAETGAIDLSEDDPEAVEHMIHYFYHLDYLTKPKSRRASRRSSPPSSPIYSVSPTRRRSRKLNLALVEDPLLAQAAASGISHQANPLTPDDERANPFDVMASKFPPPDIEKEDMEEDPLENAFSEHEPDTAQANLLVHTKVYAIAEKYGIQGLKALSRAKFSTQISLHWSSPEFADTIFEVYETTVDSDRGLRDLVVQTFREHPELASRKDVEAVVKDTPGLAWELFRVGWGMPAQ